MTNIICDGGIKFTELNEPHYHMIPTINDKILLSVMGGRKLNEPHCHMIPVVSVSDGV